MRTPPKNYAFDKFDEAVQEAINWGLLSPDSSYPRLLTIQPVFPYFLKTKLETLDDATRAALREGFKNHYQDLAGTYQQFMDSKDPDKRKLGQFFCQLEYENLYNALQISLEKHENISIFFCLDKYFELTSDTQSKLNMAEMVCQGLEKYPTVWKEGELGYQVVMAIDSLAKGYLNAKQPQQAIQLYERVLEVIQALRSTKERDKQGWLAHIYHNLGIVAQELRDFKEARRNYQLALDINIEFSDRYSSAPTYHELGIIAQELRDFKEARRNYQLALEIYIKFDDHHYCASTYHNLGMVAQDLREFEEARRNYQLALEIYIKYGDRHNQADTYHNLGMVAQDLREFEEARRNYQLALEIFIKFGERHSSASTYHQLGSLAQDLREFEEARRNYQLALEISIEYGDRYGCASTYHQLGLLTEAEEDFSEARANLQKALEIYLEFKDEYRAAITQQALERLSD